MSSWVTYRWHTSVLSVHLPHLYLTHHRTLTTVVALFVRLTLRPIVYRPTSGSPYLMTQCLDEPNITNVGRGTRWGVDTSCFILLDGGEFGQGVKGLSSIGFLYSYKSILYLRHQILDPVFFDGTNFWNTLSLRLLQSTNNSQISIL